MAQIVDLSPKPIGQLLAYLKQQETALQQGTQQAQGANLQQALQALDPLEHTLGCVFLL